jgi:hypothetical protein
MWASLADRALSLKRWVVSIIGILLVACTTTVARNEYYPASWPSIVAAGDICQDFQGTYGNKGEAVDERGGAESLWLSDWFGPYNATDTSERTRQEFRDYERVALKLEPGLSLQSGERYWRLVVEPSRQGALDPALGSDAVPSRRMDGYSGGGYPCRHGNLHWLRCPSSHQIVGGDCNCSLALGSDGSLIANCHASLPGIFVVVPVYLSKYFWVRFDRAR